VNASPRLAVVADSTPGLPAELIAEHEIREVSLYVGLEGKQERESEITDLNEFYERLRASEETVTTSQPSIGDFIEVYEPLLDDGREIVSVHLSAGISGTYESAVQARERLSSEGKGGDRIHVVDSKTAAGGHGLVLLAAARAATAGDGVEQVLAKTNTAIDSVKVWFAVNTLEYLRRGGRIGGAAAWLGTTLQIKPVLTFAEEVEPVERVRTRAKSLERLVGYARSRHDDGFDGWVVQHIQDPDAAAKMVEECTPIFGCEPMFVSEIGPVLGAHAGPGLIGVGATDQAALSL
jgi:DegV family protein with EDD domain